MDVKTKIFKDKLEARYTGEYVLLGTYSSARVATEFKHLTCGETFSTTPEAILNKKNKFGSCRKCSYTSRVQDTMTTEIALVKMKEVYPDGDFQLLSEVDRSDSLATFYHASCGNEFQANLNGILYPDKRKVSLHRKFCPSCKDNKTSTVEEFKAEVLKLGEGEFELLSETYTSNKDKVKILHKVCGTILEMRPNNFRNGDRCRLCSGLEKKTHEEYLTQFYTMPTNKEFEVVSEFNGNNNDVRVKHTICGTEKDINARNGMRPITCHKCTKDNDSMGAYLIERYLRENNHQFVKEKTFENCKRINLLRYDFFLPEYNLLIEFDGAQHFQTRDTEDNRVRKERDEIKNDFVRASNGYYTLVRIRYDQDPIVIMRDILENDQVDENVFVICF